MHCINAPVNVNPQGWSVSTVSKVGVPKGEHENLTSIYLLNSLYFIELKKYRAYPHPILRLQLHSGPLQHAPARRDLPRSQAHLLPRRVHAPLRHPDREQFCSLEDGQSILNLPEGLKVIYIFLPQTHSGC